MFERLLSFIRELPAGAHPPGHADDPKVAAAALMFHVMDADGARRVEEIERLRQLLGETFALKGAALDRVMAEGEEADSDAVDLYAFTSVLKRHLDTPARIEFIRILWEVVYADRVLHELEDNIVWRVAELIGVERHDRIAMRQQVVRHTPGATGTPDDA